ncbi:MAG TPA: hypothetical protein VJG49_02200 [Candidatus Nanoarchaeia archaeon]|nr:hypothetical protein [Candidatus Nanoarchaeia archaeon]
MRTISISSDVFAQLPNLQIVFFVVKNLKNNQKMQESQHLFNDLQELTKLTYHQKSSKNKMLLSPLKIAQQEYGKQMRHYHSSLERLLQEVLAKKKQRTDTLTNLVHYLMLRYSVPLGVDDIELIQGNLTFAMDGSHLYYYDRKVTLGTNFDYWKNSNTKVTMNSTSALIHFPFLPHTTPEQARELTQELQSLVKSFCGGSIKTFTLNSKKRKITF